MIIAIDPGPEKSALVIWNGASIVEKLYEDNQLVLNRLKQSQNQSPS